MEDEESSYIGCSGRGDGDDGDDESENNNKIIIDKNDGCDDDDNTGAYLIAENPNPFKRARYGDAGIVLSILSIFSFLTDSHLPSYPIARYLRPFFLWRCPCSPVLPSFLLAIIRSTHEGN